MCTSFVDRHDDIIIAMNFDNNGTIFKLNDKDSFIINVHTNRGQIPSFGINNTGTFVNDLSVDSNGKGLYCRANKNRTLTSYLVKDILEKELLPENFDEYFNTMEIVNVPNSSTHCMIVDKNGNSWIVEPGRGVLKNASSPYTIMTNFSIIDHNNGKEYSENGIERYNSVKNALDKTKSLNVEKALTILEEVKQTGEWETDFSMVYSQKENKVYYCYNSDFHNILEYKF